MSKAVTEGTGVGIAVEAMEEALEAITGGTLTATAIAMAITGDTDTVGGVTLIGGAIHTGGVIGGVTLIGGVILTILLMVRTMIPTTILISTKAMKGRRCLQKGLLPRRNRDSNLLIGTSVRTRKVTSLMCKIARLAG